MQIIRSGILVFSVLIIRKLAWNKISRKAQYALWMFVLIYLLLAEFITIPVNIGNDLFGMLYKARVTEDVITVVENYYNEESNIKDMDQDDHEQNNDLFIVHGKRQEINDQDQVIQRTRDFDSYFKLIIKCKNYGSLILAILILLSNTIFISSCIKNRIPYKRDETTGMNIYLLEYIGSAFLIGRDIYVDISVTGNSKVMRHIILHECVHYKHLDHIWVIARNICLVLNWYNPFMWIAYEYMKRDCELACDEGVISILGDGDREDYGLTLLSIAGRKRNKYPLALTIMMSSNAKRIRERIYSISDRSVNSTAVIVSVVIGMFVMTGCAFTGSREMLTDHALDEKKNEVKVNVVKQDIPADLPIEKDVSEGEMTEDDLFYEMTDESDNYYNLVKSYGNYLYYSDDDGLKRLKNDLSQSEILADGHVRLGNVDNGYIYYIRYHVNDNESAGILRMRVDDKKEEKLIPWSDEMWLYTNIYATDNRLYIEGRNICECYEPGTDDPLPENENIIYQCLDKCGIDQHEINDLIPGYLNTCFNYGKLVRRDFNGKNYSLEIYDIVNGELTDTITGCDIGSLVTDKGVVYSNQDGNIYLRSFAGEDIMLYDMNDNDGVKVYYGNFDNNYLYGFTEENDDLRLLKLSWSTDIIKGKALHGSIKDLPSINFSINNDIQSYREDGKIVFEYVSERR